MPQCGMTFGAWVTAVTGTGLDVYDAGLDTEVVSQSAGDSAFLSGDSHLGLAFSHSVCLT